MSAFRGRPCPFNLLIRPFDLKLLQPILRIFVPKYYKPIHHVLDCLFETLSMHGEIKFTKLCDFCHTDIY